jgi:hypothetical protein
MKRFSRIVVLVSFLSVCGAVQPSHAQSVSGMVAKNFWIKAYSGFDVANLGDVVTGINNWGAYATALGYTTTQKTDTGHFVAGGEFGFQFDPDDAISVGCENLWGSTLSSDGTESGGTYAFTYTPSVFDCTLNYYRTLVKSQVAKTLVSIGGGYYAATGTMGFTVSALPSQDFTGTFNGNTIGGVLGLTEEFTFGDVLGIQVAVKGRLATIPKMTSTNLQNAGGTVPAGTYDLVNTSSPTGGSNFKVLYAQSESTPYTTGSTTLDAQDESGIEGDFEVAVHF